MQLCVLMAIKVSMDAAKRCRGMVAPAAGNLEKTAEIHGLQGPGPVRQCIQRPTGCGAAAAALRRQMCCGGEQGHKGCGGGGAGKQLAAQVQRQRAVFCILSFSYFNSQIEPPNRAS